MFYLTVGRREKLKHETKVVLPLIKNYITKIVAQSE